MNTTSVHFSPQGLASLFTFPNEKILFTTRQHPFVIIGSVLGIVSIASLVVMLMSFISVLLHLGYIWQIVSSACVFLVVLHAIIRLVVNWYFHVYIVTTEKIMELNYQPGTLGKVNEVLLEQVRCTEIDVEVRGITNQILDAGNIIFTFDRPTHQEEFLFEYVASPESIRHHLSSILNLSEPQSQQVWVRTRHGRHPFRFMEDISGQLSQPGGVVYAR